MKTKSSEWPSDVSRRFDAAISARHEGNHVEAVLLCQQALELLDVVDVFTRSLVTVELGYNCQLLGDFDRACGHYEAAVALRPRGELPSLLLFHARVALGLCGEAMIEALRITALRDSNEYRELFMSEGFRRDLDPGLLELAEQVRKQLGRFDGEATDESVEPDGG